MKKLLITGTAGFVAGYYAEFLKENKIKYEILVLNFQLKEIINIISE